MAFVFLTLKQMKIEQVVIQKCLCFNYLYNGMQHAIFYYANIYVILE